MFLRAVKFPALQSSKNPFGANSLGAQCELGLFSLLKPAKSRNPRFPAATGREQFVLRDELQDARKQG